MGNSTFKPYLEEIANAILDIDLESGRYFIKYALQDFGIPLEAYGERVVEFVNTYKL